MLKRRFVLTALSLFALGCVALPMKASASSLETEASAFVESLADQAMQALANEDITRTERVARFRDLFNAQFAVKGIGKFVLGRYWKKASAAEQTEYLKLFEDLMVVSYVDRFTDYAGESLTIEKTVAPSAKKITVYTKILKPKSAKSYAVNWRVGKGSKGFKVVDVVVEGTSMSTTLRSDFGSIIRQKGGKIAGLIDALKKKTASLQ